MLVYQKTIDEAEEVVNLLKRHKIINNLSGRLASYLKIARMIDSSWSEEEKDKFSKKYTNGEAIFALKELIELKDILKAPLSIYPSLSKESKNGLSDKIKKILSGPEFPMGENTKNSFARNYQFELRLASRLIESGYQDIIFGENPDFVVNVKNRQYAFECKRIFGLSEKAIISNTLAAITQLKRSDNQYFGGIVALDVSPQYEKGQNWLTSTSEKSVEDYMTNELARYTFYLNKRIQELSKSASKGILLALMLNISAV